jgi:hypothetical protein
MRQDNTWKKKKREKQRRKDDSRRDQMGWGKKREKSIQSHALGDK